MASLHRAAAQAGELMGEQARAGVEGRASREKQPTATFATLAANGYEPRRVGDNVVLANCSFHALAQTHTDLVCGMNLALLGAVADRLGDGRIVARLDPAPDRCCVVLDTRAT